MIHIDGDLLVYRCGFAAEKTHYYLTLDDQTVKHFPSKKEASAWLDENVIVGATRNLESRRELEPVENALYNVRSVVGTILEKTGHGVEEAIVYLSGPTNFRLDRATLRPYKGNRDPEHKPAHGPAIKEYIHRHYQTVVSADQEADDDIGIAHRAAYNVDPYGSIIASTDKDLDMVPGMHYNFVKDLSYFVNENDARLNFYRQLITGDTTDNIPGVPGAGKVAAEKTVANFVGVPLTTEACKLLEGIIEGLYVQAYGDEGRAAMEECGELLWIRQYPGQGVEWIR